jgi:hypothetical protein
MSNSATHRRLNVWCSDWRIVAAAAGATYSVSLFGFATLLGIARNVWVGPLTDPDNALAIEAMVLLPCAWIICSTVAQAMRLPGGWRPATVMSIVTFLMLAPAYAAVSVIANPLDPVMSSLLASSIVFQGLIAAIPLTVRSAAR